MNRKNVLFFVAGAIIFCTAAQAQTALTDNTQNNQYGIKHPTTYKYIGEVPKNNKKAKAKNDIDKKLNLTEEQKAQIKQTKQEYRQKIAPLREQMQLKRKELGAIRAKQELSQEDKDKADALKKEISELRAQMQSLNQEKSKKIESTLSDEQKQTLKKYNKERRKNFKNKKNSRNTKKRQRK